MRIGEQQKKILLVLLAQNYNYKKNPNVRLIGWSDKIGTGNIVSLVYPDIPYENQWGHRHYDHHKARISITNSLKSLEKSGLVKVSKGYNKRIPGGKAYGQKWNLTPKGKEIAERIYSEISQTVVEYERLVKHVKQFIN